MRLKGLDLNLLVALDILLEERSVSRAAERLHLSQPAASAALARLRDYFQDQLLVLHGTNSRGKQNCSDVIRCHQTEKTFRLGRIKFCGHGDEIIYLAYDTFNFW